MFFNDFFKGSYFLTDKSEPISYEQAQKLAFSIADILTYSKCRPLVIIGRDTSVSSEMAENVMQAALLACGADVMSLGIISAPAVSWITNDINAAFGIMICAEKGQNSSNTVFLFGHKGKTLDKNTLSRIEKRFFDKDFSPVFKKGKNLGRTALTEDKIRRYILHVCDGSDNVLNGLKVALDCANGSVISTAGRVFTQLGAECFVTGNTPDGFNVEKGCGADRSPAIRDFVLEKNCDIGFSFDNSGMRCIASDETGGYINGEVISAVIASYLSMLQTLNNNSVILTKNTNLGVLRYLEQNNITVFTEENVKDNLKTLAAKTESNFACDNTGYASFLDIANISDGQYTAVVLCAVMLMTDMSLSEITKDIVRYRPAEVEIRVPQKALEKFNKDKIINEAVKKAEKDIDGRINLIPNYEKCAISVICECEAYSRSYNTALNITKIIKDRYIK